MKKISKIVLVSFSVLSFMFFTPFHNVQAQESTIKTLQTRIEVLLSQIAILQADLDVLLQKEQQPTTTPINETSTTIASVAKFCPTVNRNLSYSSRDLKVSGDITQLQKFLAGDTAIYPEGLITGFYGSLTRKAVRRFQVKYNIVSSGTAETTGYGVVGPKTRAKIKAVCPTPEEAPILQNLFREIIFIPPATVTLVPTQSAVTKGGNKRIILDKIDMLVTTNVTTKYPSTAVNIAFIAVAIPCPDILGLGLACPAVLQNYTLAKGQSVDVGNLRITARDVTTTSATFYIELIETKCTDYSVVKINDNQGFIYTYNNDSELQAIPEKNFEGILKEYKKLPPGVFSFVQRELTYNLDGKAVFTTTDDLSKYVGKRVILIGKNYKFELEGTQRDEIWPVSIVCKVVNLVL